MTPPPASDALARYQRVRRPVEIGFWVIAIGIQCLLNTLVSLADVRAHVPGLASWKPVVWELSSHAMVLALIPAIVAWVRARPLRWEAWRAFLAWHLLGSVLFSLVHVTGMVLLRLPVHALAGEPYQPGPWLSFWIYEYLKDFRAYALIAGTVAGYRLFMMRWQGEARLLDAPEPPVGPAAQASPGPADEAVNAPGLPPAPPAFPPRFLVRKLRSEFLIAAADVAWVQAQGNYVALHVNGHDYLLRSTLADFQGQLDPTRFLRVHRSHVVNLDQVLEIEPLDSGDAKLRMRDGSTVPCSRRHRAALVQALQGGTVTADGAESGATD